MIEAKLPYLLFGDCSHQTAVICQLGIDSALMFCSTSAEAAQAALLKLLCTSDLEVSIAVTNKHSLHESAWCIVPPCNK